MDSGALALAPITRVTILNSNDLPFWPMRTSALPRLASADFDRSAPLVDMSAARKLMARRGRGASSRLNESAAPAPRPRRHQGETVAAVSRRQVPGRSQL
jgi:hypothetical protein